jgi:hypothetical protein
VKALLKSIWPFSASYEVRVLNRDARYVIEDSTERFSDERLVQMANATRAYLTDAREQMKQPQFSAANVLPHFQDLHRTARREQQDMALSALTLILIFLRAQQHAERCQPALNAIDEFVEQWASNDEEDAPTGRVGRLQA